MLMKTETFLSANKLGLLDIFYDGLKQTLFNLEHEIYEETPIKVISRLAFGNCPRAGFSMAVFKRQYVHRGYETVECNTVACIAGWAATYADMDNGAIGSMMDHMTSDQKWRFRYLMQPPGFEIHNFTQKQAAYALRTYLETGNARWQNR